MPEPPPTDTVTKSLKGAENAIISHGRVQGCAMQRLRSQLSKWIVECAQGDQSYRTALSITIYVRSVPGDAIAAYHNTSAKRLHQYI